MPSPRTSEAGTQVGAFRDNGARSSEGISPGSDQSPGESTRVNPTSARTSLSRWTQTFSKQFSYPAGGSTEVSSKSEVFLVGSGIEKTCHSGSFGQNSRQER